MELLERNLSVLRERDPRLADAVAGADAAAVEVARARSGDPVPVVEGRALHSTYEPREEARRWAAAVAADAPAIVCLGFGFGFHVEAILERAGEAALIVEKRLDLLRRALEVRDLRGLLERVRILASPPPSAVATQETLEAAGTGGPAVVSYEPLVRLAPGYYAAVRAELGRPLPSRGGRLRVAVVSPIYGGSFDIARHAARGLEALGCETSFVDLSPFQPARRHVEQSLRETTAEPRMLELLFRYVSEYVYWRIRQAEPDLVLFLAQAPAGPELLGRLREEKLRTAFWFVENSRTITYWNQVAPHCDAFFTMERGGFFDRLDAAGAFNHFYLPLAADPGVHRPLELLREERARFGSEVAMAGFGYYNRLHVLQGMTDFRLKLWGPGWGRARLLQPFIQEGGAEFDAETMVKIYNATAVNLNLHASTYVPGVEPDGESVNPRTFELAACGAFQLVDARAELPRLFEVGREMVTFTDLVTLRDQTRHFLDHPRERRTLAAAARERALRDHTYAIRMRQMLECLFPKAWLGRRTTEYDDPNRAGRLRARVARGHDLEPLLGSFPEGADVTLPALLASAAGRGGPPGRAELTLRWIETVLQEGVRR